MSLPVIQTIQKPIRARAWDTSTSEQLSGNFVADPKFTGAGNQSASTTGTYWTTGTDVTIQTGTLYDTGSGIGNREGYAFFDDTASDGNTAVGNCLQGWNEKNKRGYGTSPQGDIRQGDKFQVTYTVTGYTAGSVRISLFSVSSAGDGNHTNDGGYSVYRGMTTIKSANGTYTEDITVDELLTGSDYNNSVVISSATDAGSDGDELYKISNVSVRRYESYPSNNHGQIYSGRALEFDGTSDYIDTGMAFSETNCTVAVWAYIDDLGATADIICARDSDNEGILIRTNSAEQILFKVGDGSTTNTITSSRTYKSTWIRIVGTYDGSTQRLYINGVEAGSASISITIPSVTSNVFIGARSFTSQINIFSGKLSDVQLWNATWSASDVLFDYQNPERLALNNSGTSLTESNLKLWYPMNDGHRGQQSYILDASNTGVGSDDLVTNGAFESNISGWTAKDCGTLEHETSSPISGSGSIKVPSMTNANGGPYQDMSLTAGVTYKVTGSMKLLTGGSAGEVVVINSASNGTSQSVVYTGTTNELSVAGDSVDFTAFFTAATSKPSVQFACNQSDGSFLLDNVVVKAVNDKNHGTTVFYGDNLYTAANALRVAADGTTADEINDTAGWSNTGTSTFATASTAHSGSKSLHYVANANDGRVYADLNSYMTVGRKYKLSIFARHVGSGGTQRLRFSSATSMTADVHELTNGAFEVGDTTFAEAYLEFVYDGDEYRYFGAKEYDGDGSTGSGGLYMDTLYIKEQGTAKGWTEADQQQIIPQTALQSYNQLMWFDGSSDYVEIANNAAYNFTDGSDDDEAFTVSAWVFINDLTAGFPIIGKYQSGSTREWLLGVGQSSPYNKLEFQVYDEGANAKIGRKYNGTAITTGEWHHIVGTYTGNNANSGFNLYLNGENVDDADFDTGTYVGVDDLTGTLDIGRDGANGKYANGCITEVSIWNKSLSQAEVNELYNDGLALDATAHSGFGDLLSYWRNNGLSEWKDLKNPNVTTFDGTPDTNATETMLITAGADASRDSQGFIMSRQRATSSLNLAALHGNSLQEDKAIVIDKGDDLDAGTGTVSMECWFKTVSSGVPMPLIAKQTTNYQGAGYHIRINASQKLAMVFSDGSQYIDAAGDTSVCDGKWHHVVATYDGTDTGNIYLDGEVDTPEETSTVASIDSLSNTGDLGIGHNPAGSADQGFDGEIDGINIYIGKALSTTEVKRNYNAGKRSHR